MPNGIPDMPTRAIRSINLNKLGQVRSNSFGKITIKIIQTPVLEQSSKQKQHRWRQLIKRNAYEIIQTRVKPIHDHRRVRKRKLPNGCGVNNH